MDILNMKSIMNILVSLEAHVTRIVRIIVNNNNFELIDRKSI